MTRAVLSEGKRAQVNRGRFPWDFLQRTYDAGEADKLERYFEAMPFDPFLFKDGHVRRDAPVNTDAERP